MKKAIIEWFDASGVTHDSKTWLSEEECLKIAEEKYNDRCITLGFIIEKNSKYIIMAGTKAYGVYSDVSLIPIKMIHSIRYLK